MTLRATLVAACLVFAHLASPSTANARDQVTPATNASPDAVIPLERWRTRWFIRVDFGGAERKLLFDTGAGLTLLHPDVLSAAKCELWGRVTGFRMFGQRGDGPRCNAMDIFVAGHPFRPPLLGAIELGTLNPADAELEGIAALNMFEGRAITLNLGEGEIIVESPASLHERVRSMRPFPIRMKREVEGTALAIMAEVTSPRGPVWMELDSGNGGTVLVAKHNAALFGLQPDTEEPQSGHFQVAEGVNLQSEHMFTPDMIMDGNLGMPFLHDWIITLDLREGRGWIVRNPEAGPAPKPALPSKTSQ
ncbi:hypothetical protein K5P26_02480 [Sphingopyxis sp. XHP0097]|uniref:Aspartyl protease n=1 Tax=Sphingopyxis jiangsuensis TaxID=2871171 RepID=A0ABS7MAG5_9SPHN|nr:MULTISPECIES: hypothetical protein [Sphingopyxis]MBY4636005.1 hypothetical protein [Sphingopyxis jiangsuensis]